MIPVFILQDSDMLAIYFIIQENNKILGIIFSRDHLFTGS
jgi:hypothetical protein